MPATQLGHDKRLATGGAFYSALEERAKELKAKLSLTIRTEFGFSKGGLRFPSRHTIIEAYVKEKSPPSIRSEIVVEYGPHQFFTVKTQVELKKVSRDVWDEPSRRPLDSRSGPLIGRCSLYFGPPGPLNSLPNNT